MVSLLVLKNTYGFVESRLCDIYILLENPKPFDLGVWVADACDLAGDAHYLRWVQKETPDNNHGKYRFPDQLAIADGNIFIGKRKKKK
jgi:hypothetical protein